MLIYFGIAVSLVVFVVTRYIYLINNRTTSRNDTIAKAVNKSVKTVIIIGSGGHTSEMLKLTLNINVKKFSPRIYIMSDSDTTSAAKIHAVEANRPQDYCIVTIPRSRNVNQSYLTSVATTIYASLKSIPIMLRLQPDLVLCNGPGTCVPICTLAFVFKLIWLFDPTIVFVESICRVKTLSLTGKIMLHFADQIIVQWPNLQSRYKGTLFLGKLF